LNKISLLIAIEKDSLSYHIWNRTINGNNLFFTMDSTGSGFQDNETNSFWNMKGECVDGNLKGNKLSKIQGHQQYWRSWRTFHKNTSQWK